MESTTLIPVHEDEGHSNFLRPDPNEFYAEYLRLSGIQSDHIPEDTLIAVRTPPPLHISQDTFLRPHLVEPILEVIPRSASWFSVSDLEQLSWYRNGTLEHARLEEAARRLSDEIDRSFINSITNGIAMIDGVTTMDGIAMMNGQLYKTSMKPKQPEEPEPYFVV